MTYEKAPRAHFTTPSDNNNSSGVNTSPKNKPKKIKKKNSGGDQGRINPAKLNKHEAGQYLLDTYYKANPNMSSLEKMMHTAILSAFISPSQSTSVSDVVCSCKNIKSQINFLVPGIDTICKESKCQVLILSSSALRSIEIMRKLPKLREKCTIGKLFAKHIKIGEQLSLLRCKSVPIAIGTPARVLAISLADPELFSRVKFVIIDVARDIKLRSIFDMAEIRGPLLDLLFKNLFEKVKNGHTRFIFAD